MSEQIVDTAPKRLDRGKAANDGVAIRHPLDADGERDRHHRGQAFGDRGYGDTDRSHERVLHFIAPRHEGENTDAGGERQNDNRQALGENVHLTQKRRGERFDAPDHGADAPELSRGAGRDHQTCALPARDHRAGIGHRGAVAERCVGRDGIDRLVGSGRFAGQHRLLDLEACGAQEPEVGGNAVARFRQHDVADHEAFGRNGQPPPVAQNRGLAGQHRADGLERLFSPPFLDESNHPVDDDDGEDHHGVESVAQQDGDERRSEEDIDQEVVELSEHAREQGAPLARRQAVRAVRLEAPRGFVGAQSLRRGLAKRERGLRRLGMPGALGLQGQILHRSMKPLWRSALCVVAFENEPVNLVAPLGGQVCLDRPSTSR